MLYYYAITLLNSSLSSLIKLFSKDERDDDFRVLAF